MKICLQFSISGFKRVNKKRKEGKGGTHGPVVAKRPAPHGGEGFIKVVSQIEKVKR
jgi:hypothetical protein